MSETDASHFHDAEAARKHLEAIRWPDGPVCPHCGTVGAAYGTSRPGLYRCASAGCRMDFSVTVGTVFERSHVPLHKWFLAVYWLCSSKKGCSAHQLHRMLGVTYKTAWFMAHRIREAMKDGGAGMLGGPLKTVQVDETYFGTKDEYRGKSWPEKKGLSKKMAVLSLVEPGGRSRTFHVDRADMATIRDILKRNVRTWSVLHTDESRLYIEPGKDFTAHRTVNHGGGEYVRGDVTTNNVENFFSVFKRGMRGVYQHCSEKHLQRYLTEFDFRYNNRAALGVTDSVRMTRALVGIEGKRLMYGGN